MMTPIEYQIRTIIRLHGMETLLWYTKKYVDDERAKGEELYLMRLSADLSVAYNNYKRRNENEGENHDD
jgi:hypothetical protein